MMLWIPKLYLLLATSVFWGSQGLSAKKDSVCDRISDKGFIHIKTGDLTELEDICNCKNLR